jgi:hypothetical protein
MNLFVLFYVIWGVCTSALASDDAWMKAKSLVQQMTLEEKFSMMCGTSVSTLFLFTLLY